ncbi:MAG: hypothetical protein HY698_05300 [Deltaproteobacteria bacterium]|nr:hypothetical protein [Deltaproteobacteria bacterium]
MALEIYSAIAPRGLYSFIRSRVLVALVVAAAGVLLAMSAWKLLNAANHPRLGAILLPALLSPLLLSARLFRRAAWNLCMARRGAGSWLRLDPAGFGWTQSGGTVEASWAEVESIALETPWPGEPLGKELVLVIAPRVDAPGRPVTLRFHDHYAAELEVLCRRILELRAQHDGSAALAEERARALDMHCFAMAAIGDLLPPGCFVVRGRRTHEVSLLLTPRAMLVGQKDACQRIPWSVVTRIELGDTMSDVLGQRLPGEFLRVVGPGDTVLASVPVVSLAMCPEGAWEVAQDFLSRGRHGVPYDIEAAANRV